MKTQRLMRMWYQTEDYEGEGTIGTRSAPIPAEDEGLNRGWRIVAVDWTSMPGEVEVTWLIPG